MKYTYLLLNVFTILIPLSRSFESRIQFYKKLPALIPAILITALFFLVWDYFKTSYGVWGFNPRYVMGYYILGLPIEEILFFFTVPYACAFIYETIAYFSSTYGTYANLKMVARLLALPLFISSLFLFSRAYTFSILFIGGPVLFFSTYLMGDTAFKNLGLTFVISLLPMAVVNGFLTALPVVIYNNTQNLNVRIGTIPVEDFGYSAILLTMNLALYEWQKSKHFVAKAKPETLSCNV